MSKVSLSNTNGSLNTGGKIVGLDKLDNTSDLNKAISIATQTALNLKADKIYVDASLNLKANKTYVDTSLNTNYYVKSYVDASLNLKADKTYVDTSLNTNYYVKSYVDASLNLKVDKTYLNNYYSKSDVDASLNLKADISFVNQSMTNLINGAPETLDTLKEISDYIKDSSFSFINRIGIIDTSLNLKADKMYVDASLNLKADKSYVDASFSTINTRLNNIDTSLNTLSTGGGSSAATSISSVWYGDNHPNGTIWFDQESQVLYFFANNQRVRIPFAP